MKRHTLSPTDIVDLNIPNYAHGMVVEGAAKWVHLSGQIGMAPDGTVADGFEAQCRQAFTNIKACLRDAEMTLDDVVMLRIYLIRQEDLATFRRIRGEVFGERIFPSTLLFISGLVTPALLVELEVVAAA